MRMTLQNPPKAFIALVLIICLTLLLAFHSIGEAAGMGPIGLIVGYIIGNGVAARGGVDVEPIIGQNVPAAE